MKVTIERFEGTDQGVCRVVAEEDDPTFYKESRMMYHIKKALNAQGHDLIKKRMWKDGHMVDDLQQYLRTRKPTGDPNKDIFVHDLKWVVRDGAEEYRRNGTIDLRVTFDVFEEHES